MIRHVTLSIQDQAGRPTVSVGLAAEVDQSDDGRWVAQALTPAGVHLFGSGRTSEEACVELLRTYVLSPTR